MTEKSFIFGKDRYGRQTITVYFYQKRTARRIPTLRDFQTKLKAAAEAVVGITVGAINAHSFELHSYTIDTRESAMEIVEELAREYVDRLKPLKQPYTNRPNGLVRR